MVNTWDVHFFQTALEPTEFRVDQLTMSSEQAAPPTTTAAEPGGTSDGRAAASQLSAAAGGGASQSTPMAAVADCSCHDNTNGNLHILRPIA